jgi:hypothetical protein
MTTNNATTWALSVFESDLTPTQKLICLYLRTHMNDYQEVAWPSVGRIAAKCGISDRTVFRELPKICAAGYLMQNGKSDLGTVRYAISNPPDTVSPLTPCQKTPDTVSPELTKELTNTTTTKAKRFVPPTLEQVTEYILEMGYSVNPEGFHSYYSANDWKVGRNKMKSWKAAITHWQTKEKQNGRGRVAPPTSSRNTTLQEDLNDTSWAN